MRQFMKGSALPYVAVAAFSMGLVLLPYISGNFILPRTEELSYSLYPLILWARQLASGEAPLWFADAGLGIPWPIPHTMSHTPLLFFFAALPVYKALAALLAVHIAVQAFFTVRIARYFGLAPMTTAVVLISVLLAAPMEYLVSSDAAAVYVSWTLLPVIFYALLRLTEPVPPRQIWGYAALLGGAVGYGFLNGHVGMFSAPLLGVGLVAVFQPWIVTLRWHLFLSAALLALGIGAEKIFVLLDELPNFGADAVRLQYSSEQTLGSLLWNMLLKPFVLPGFFGGRYWDIFVAENAVSRTFAFGSPLCTVLLLFGIWRFIQGHRLIANASLERAMWWTLATCFLLQWVPVSVLPIFISAAWSFRDAAILIALFLAALLCEKWLREVLRSETVTILLAAHTAMVLLSAAIFTFGPGWRTVVRGSPADVYDHLSASSRSFPLQQMILDYLDCAEDAVRCQEPQRRVVYDGRAALLAHNGLALASGLHLNLLPLAGLQDVSFFTKGLSLDTIHPSQSKPYGMISTLRFAGYKYQPDAFDWVKNAPALVDLLGIQMIVGQDDPIYVAHGFNRIGVINPKAARKEDVLVLYANPRAYSRAFFVDEEVLSRVRRNADCPNHASFLTCMDVSPIANATDRRRDAVQVQQGSGRMTFSFAPAGRPRILLVSTMFRPEWRPSDGKLSSFHGLMRLNVPAGINGLTVEYVPTRLIVLRIITCVSAILAILVGLIAYLFAGSATLAGYRQMDGRS